jgi:tetratricopeptide (TPR) repeat protein
MAIVARGTVADRPWGRTFAFVASRGFTGELALVADGKRYTVGWRGGAVVAAASPLVADAVARIAMTAQLINPSQVGEIMRAQAAAPDVDEIDVIARTVGLSAEQTQRLRRRAVATRAMRTFAIPAGELTLDDAVEPSGGPELAIDARAIAFAGVKAHFEDKRLLEELAWLGLTFRLRDEAIAELAQYGFGEPERRPLEILRDRTVSPHELEQACPDAEPKTVRALLYVLACFGAAESRGSAAPRSASPSIAPPVRPASPSIAAPVRSASPSIAQPPPRAAPASQPPPRPAPSTSQPPPRAAPASQPPPARDKVASVPPPVPAPPPDTLSPDSTGDWSEASSPAVRRTRPRVRSSSPPTATARADADRIRNLVADRLAALERGADHFALLGVNDTAAPDQVRAAYFSLARQLHPDRLSAAGVADERREAQRLFAQINAAFGVLSNPKRRSEYLQMLHRGGAAVARAEEAEAEELATRLFGAEEHFRRGEMALRRDQLDAAHAEFKEAVALNPAEGEHHALLAWTTYALARDKAAVRVSVRKMFEEAMRLAPRSVTPYIYMGRIARLEGKDEDAIAHFEQALKMMPGHSEAASELRVLEARRGTQPPRKPDDKPKGGLFGFIKKT